MQQSFDVVMPILQRDWQAAQAGLTFVQRNLPLARLVVVSSPALQSQLPQQPNLVFVDENALVPGLSLDAVKQVIYSRVYSDKRAGWLFQQFLKLAYARVCPGPAYITWDADTIPVRPIPFENEAGQFLFTLKAENHQPYFDTIRTLLGLEKALPESFIAENMIFDAALVRAMLDEIEANEAVEGVAFWEKILHAIRAEDLQKSGFSEFETYGTYVMTRHPGRYATRSLATLRSGKNILGSAPTPAMLAWAGESYDTVSMEKFSAVTPLCALARSAAYRKGHTAAQLEALKNRFRLIPAVYGFGRGLWPKFKVWAGRYRRRLRAARDAKR